MSTNIQIKGIREGLLITLPEGEWDTVQNELLTEVSKQQDFFKGAKVILDVENHVLNARSMGKLVDLLGEQDVSLWAVLSNSPKTEETAQTYGLATRIHQTNPEADKRPIDSTLDGDAGVLVRKTLRSGNSITFPGHVTVIGDVNPGAEIVAGGDIVVWGKLRGMVHAGAEGDESAVVCALELNPMQLRIAGQIAISPQEKEKKHPEVARIRDGQVIAEQWQN